MIPPEPTRRPAPDPDPERDARDAARRALIARAPAHSWLELDPDALRGIATEPTRLAAAPVADRRKGPMSDEHKRKIRDALAAKKSAAAS